MSVCRARSLTLRGIDALPDAAVQEARERVRVAISNSGYKFPTKKVIVNLAPANLRKEGTAFDLPIALAVLAFSGVFPLEKLESTRVVGELSLDGDLRSIRGVKVHGVAALREAVDFFEGKARIPAAEHSSNGYLEEVEVAGDFEDVSGQGYAKRALEVAAIDRMGLSGRAHNRILRVARTVADLSSTVDVAVEHIAEALNYRRSKLIERQSA